MLGSLGLGGRRQSVKLSNGRGRTPRQKGSARSKGPRAEEAETPTTKSKPSRVPTGYQIRLRGHFAMGSPNLVDDTTRVFRLLPLGDPMARTL